MELNLMPILANISMLLTCKRKILALTFTYVPIYVYFIFFILNTIDFYTRFTQLYNFVLHSNISSMHLRHVLSFWSAMKVIQKNINLIRLKKTWLSTEEKKMTKWEREGVFISVTLFVLYINSLNFNNNIVNWELTVWTTHPCFWAALLLEIK